MIRNKQNELKYSELDTIQSNIDHTSSYGWGTLIVLMCAILFAYKGYIHWQYDFFIVVLIVSYICLLTFFKETSAKKFLPLAALITLSPMILNFGSTKPWMFYNLFLDFVVFYLALVLDFIPSIFSIIAVGVIQRITFISHFKMIVYGSNLIWAGAPSQLWTIVAGLVVVAYRYNFDHWIDSTENSIEKDIIQNEAHERYASLISHSDPVNVTIHGTILNTYSMIRNKFPSLSTTKQIRDQFKSDLREIRASIIGKKGNLYKELKKFHSEQSQLGITVDINVKEHLFLEQDLEIGILEFIREACINLTRHGNHKHIEVSLTVSQNGKIYISISHYTKKDNIDQEIKLIVSSKTLIRIVRSLGANYKVSKNFAGNHVDQELFIDPRRLSKNVARKIYNANEDFTNGIYRSAMLLSSSYSFLLGLFAWAHHLHVSIVASLFSLALLTVIAAFLQSWILFFVTTAISYIPLILLFHQGYGCANLQLSTWIYDCALGSVLGVSVIIKNRILKWLPCFIYSFLASYLTLTDHLKCDIGIWGAIAGTLIIGILIFVIGRTRKNSSTLFADKLIEFEIEDSKNAETNTRVNNARELLVEEIQKFSDSLIPELSITLTPEWEMQGSLLESLVRNYVISSEFFAITLIHKIYEISYLRFLASKQTKLKIDTGFLYSLTRYELLNVDLMPMFDHFSQVDIEIYVKLDQEFHIEIKVPKEEFRELTLGFQMVRPGMLKVVLTPM
jgi:signal transduction histidine kinase